MPEVRPFVRADRDGLTSLVNRHVAAVLPGGAVPTSVLLSQLERDAHEYIIDPWVIDRHTIVGIERDRVVAAAHLKRYGRDERVSESYRDVGDIYWFVCDPKALDVGRAVLEAACGRLAHWGVRTWYADGTLPCLGVYGVPDAWPHVQQLLAATGFDDREGQVEVIFAGDLADIPAPGLPPRDDIELRRVVGPLGTSFEAFAGDVRIGVFEVQDFHGVGNTHLLRWADECNHWVAADFRGQGIGSWLLRTGGEWLRLAGKDRLLAYAIERRQSDATPLEPGHTIERCERYYARHGLVRIARTRRGWERRAD